MKIRLMSYNTQHCLNLKEGFIDFDMIANTIKELGGEIIGLQEIRGEGPMEGYTDQITELARRTGYNYYFAKAIDIAGENPYGNALLSKYPIISAETIKIPDPVGATNCESRCILKAVIDVGVPLTVLSTHFGLDAAEQASAAATLIPQIKGERCVVMGDFNITPDNPHIADISKLIFDTAELFDEPKLSFPSDAPRVKIDYIFTSRDIKALHADLLDMITSDHRPYICDIEI